MPLYEYICLDCETRSEILIRGEEEPVCPSCSGKRLEKQFSVPARGSAKSADDCAPGPGGG